MENGRRRLLFAPGRVRAMDRTPAGIRVGPPPNQPPPTGLGGGSQGRGTGKGQGVGGGRGTGKGHGVGLQEMAATVVALGASSAAASQGVVPVPVPPTFVAAGSAVRNTTGATLSVPMPAGISAGDFLALEAYTQVGLTVTTPAGWTALGSIHPAGDAFSNKWLFYKVAGSSEGNVSVSTTGSGTALDCIVYAWHGVNQASPIDVAATYGAVTSTVSVVSPSRTTTFVNSKMVYIGNDFTEAAWSTPPSGVTKRFESAGNNWTYHVFDETISSPGAVSHTFSRPTTGNGAQLAAFAIRGR